MSAKQAWPKGPVMEERVACSTVAGPPHLFLKLHPGEPLPTRPLQPGVLTALWPHRLLSLDPSLGISEQALHPPAGGAILYK